MKIAVAARPALNDQDKAIMECKDQACMSLTCCSICPVDAISKGDVMTKPGFAGDPADKKVK